MPNRVFTLIGPYAHARSPCPLVGPSMTLEVGPCPASDRVVPCLGIVGCAVSHADPIKEALLAIYMLALHTYLDS